MTDVSGTSPTLTFRQRLSWTIHFLKAVGYQYHRPFPGRIRSLIESDGVIADVGAHAGQFTKLFSRLVPRGHVYAFEPNPYALSILRKVVSVKRLGNVTIVEKGLSDRIGTEVLHVPLKKRGSVGFGLAHLGPETDRASRTETIGLTTLDRFAAERALRRLDFIKIDVEGWERYVVAGGHDTIRRFRPALLVELRSDLMVRAGATPEEVWGVFAALDYVAFRTEEHDAYRLHPVDSWTDRGDFLFVPGEKSGLVRAG